MHLFIRRPDGSTFSLAREHSGTVQDLKKEIERLEGVPLSDDAVLGDFLDSDVANVELNVELLGGAKKRKKKVYTTPKKIKRKPKKIKLAALKFYKVLDVYQC
ncbi:ribosomal 40S subunit protein S27A [Sparganum proliferum]